MTDKHYTYTEDAYSATRVKKLTNAVEKTKPIVARIKYLFKYGTDKDYAEYTRKREELDRIMAEARGTKRHHVMIAGIDFPEKRKGTRK